MCWNTGPDSGKIKKRKEAGIITGIYEFHVTKDGLHRDSEIRTLRMSNGYYDAAFFYYGDYDRDRKNGTIDRKNITVSCKSRDGGMPLDYDADGTVRIDTMGIMPSLDAEEAGRPIESLRAAGESARKLQKAAALYF